MRNASDRRRQLRQFRLDLEAELASIASSSDDHDDVWMASMKHAAAHLLGAEAAIEMADASLRTINPRPEKRSLQLV
jgi:hypothetical protein